MSEMGQTTDEQREDLRAARQAKLDRKIERMRAKADRLERDAAPKTAEFNRLRQDYAWLTQPANPNSGFGKQRQRTVDRYGVGLNMLAEAKELREKADALEKRGAVVKGDAARRDQALADALDLVIVKGSRITDFAFGDGTVARVNKKTYTVCWDRSGNTWAREKIFVRPLNPSAEETARMKASLRAAFAES